MGAFPVSPARSDAAFVDPPLPGSVIPAQPVFVPAVPDELLHHMAAEPVQIGQACRIGRDPHPGDPAPATDPGNRHLRPRRHVYQRRAAQACVGQWRDALPRR